jgi:hypothetical protein
MSKRKEQLPKLRVKNEPPTLAEAMTAAGGMSDDANQQIEIAATLLGLPLEPATIKALAAAKPRGNVVDINVRGRPQRAVVVEKKRVVRSLTRPHDITPRALSGQRLSRI